ncbi:MAG TPA: hypothetical protein VMM13_18350 [Euzebya sp.]|nr:hypothetical protein [Euzebya sp.]
MRALLIALALMAAGPTGMARAATEPPPANVPAPGSGNTTEEAESPCREDFITCHGVSGVLPGQTVAVDAGAVGADGVCIQRTATPTEGEEGPTTVSDSVPYCSHDSDGDGVADALPPPTHPEIVQVVCPSVPAPRVGHNPREYGITGLHTWLWDATQPSALSAAGVIRGYPVTCTLSPSRWVFDTGDPHAQRYGHQRVYAAGSPGTESEDTEVQHFWEVKGPTPSR